MEITVKIGVLASVGETVDAFFPPLIRRWQELGHQVLSGASTPSAATEHAVIGSLTRNPAPRNVRAPREIRDWVERNRIDVVVTNTATASFFARVRELPVPVIYFCHGLHWNESRSLRSRFWQLLERYALHCTDGVVVINDDDEAWFRAYFPAERVYRLWGGVGVPVQDYPRSDIPPVLDTVELLWAGEFSDRKRPWLALDVVEALLGEGVAVHLTMCGDGPYLAEIRAQISARGISGAVSAIGPSSEIADFLERSHGMLLTSTWEGLPRIGLESMAVGRPVFAFDVKGTRSLPGVLTVPEGDVGALARLIGGRAADDFRGIDLVEPDLLHPDRAAERILQLAEKLLGEPEQGQITAGEGA